MTLEMGIGKRLASPVVGNTWPPQWLSLLFSWIDITSNFRSTSPEGSARPIVRRKASSLTKLLSPLSQISVEPSGAAHRLHHQMCGICVQHSKLTLTCLCFSQFLRRARSAWLLHDPPHGLHYQVCCVLDKWILPSIPAGALAEEFTLGNNIGIWTTGENVHRFSYW